MGTTSEIEWTDATWQVTRGCERVSPGCGGHAHEGGCYAERMAWRLQHNPRHPLFDLGVAKMTPQGPRWTGKVLTAPDQLAVPLHWKRPRKVFVNSMSDLFHENVPDSFIAAVFGVMAARPQHTFQVLTKRPERMARWFEWVRAERERRYVGGLRIEPSMVCAQAAALAMNAAIGEDRRPLLGNAANEPWPLSNVWLGCSVEDQRRADERIPHLLRVPAAVRFLSVEPMLGPVDLRPWTRHEFDCPNCGCDGVLVDEDGCCRACGADAPAHDAIDWVIVGGESGPGARPMDEAWVRSLRDQCREAGVSFFYKQKLDGKSKISLPVLDGRRHAEWPDART